MLVSFISQFFSVILIAILQELLTTYFDTKKPRDERRREGPDIPVFLLILLLPGIT